MEDVVPYMVWCLHISDHILMVLALHAVALGEGQMGETLDREYTEEDMCLVFGKQEGGQSPVVHTMVALNLMERGALVGGVLRR